MSASESNLFYQRIYFLTGEKIHRELSCRTVHIPPCYDPLFRREKHGEQLISLNEVARLVHKIFSREEEYGDTNLDKRGRFDHGKSFLVQNGLDQFPIVDELIMEVIRQLNLKVKNIWPEGKKAVVCLTHDVDSIDGFSYFWLRELNWLWCWFKAKLMGNRREAANWLLTLKNWKRYKNINFDPMDSFEGIRELEDGYGFRSTFFFMGLCHGLSREGRRYSIQNPKLASNAEKLLTGGWEIGLHAAYHHHLSISALKEQKRALEDLVGKEITGCRHHFLRVRFPESWKIYAQAGFKYSSNMGWGSGCQGFRAGTSFPYYPLQEYSLMEIPFQLMDTNPIDEIESYMNKFRQYLKSVKAVNGCLVIDFHQEHFQEGAAPGAGKVYRNILEFISKDPELAVLTIGEVQSIIEKSGIDLDPIRQ